jgi:DNA-binding NarL/FixJ family response regulator
MKINIYDKIIQIECSVEELKELFPSFKLKTEFSQKDSSNKPKHIIKDVAKLEKIKEIKRMAEQGMNNKDIAIRLGISPQLVNYWRKNTPKELNV